MNWTSSIISTSTERNWSLNATVSLNRKARMNWYMNFSADMYSTRRCGCFSRRFQAMACIRWVLPRPTPPYRNSGLNGTVSLSATRRAAAKASSLGLPTTKFAKLNRGSSGALIASAESAARTTSGAASDAGPASSTAPSMTSARADDSPASAAAAAPADTTTSTVRTPESSSDHRALRRSPYWVVTRSRTNRLGTDRITASPSRRTSVSERNQLR